MRCKECKKYSGDWYWCSEKCEIKYKSDRDENYAEYIKEQHTEQGFGIEK